MVGLPPAMHIALANLGLELRERLLFSQVRTSTAPTFAVVIAGLARGCSNAKFMDAVMEPCRNGAAAVMFSLQFSRNARTGKSPGDVFDEVACSDNLRDATVNRQVPSMCSTALVSQSFNASSSALAARPCAQHASAPGRTELASMSIGRAFHWALHHFPWESRFYIRARLDDIHWCVPTHLSLPSGSSWIAFNNVHAKNQTGRMPEIFCGSPTVTLSLLRRWRPFCSVSG